MIISLDRPRTMEAQMIGVLSWVLDLLEVHTMVWDSFAASTTCALSIASWRVAKTPLELHAEKVFLGVQVTFS